ncbi:hypothetical protein LTS17_005075 [Exophiala oligosperma]
MLKELADTPYEAEIDPGKNQPKPTEKGFYGQLQDPSPRLQPLLTSDPLAQSKDSWKPASLDVDYLANQASELIKALDNDPADAIAMFVKAEMESKALIESATQQAAL